MKKYSYKGKQVNPMKCGGIVPMHKKSFGGILTSAASGAATGALGATPGGPIGAGAGAIIGGAVGLAKGIFSHIAEKKAAEAQKEADAVSKAKNAAIVAQGTISGGGKLMSAQGRELNPFNLNRNGGFKLGSYNPNTDIDIIGSGGTHEENPNGGVMVGKDSNGVMQAVEEGEVMKKIGGKDGQMFIYSNSIPVPDGIPGVPKKFKGNSPAEYVKSIDTAFKDRKTPIDIAMKNHLYDLVAQYNQEKKDEMEAKQTKVNIQGQPVKQFDGGGFNQGPVLQATPTDPFLDQGFIPEDENSGVLENVTPYDTRTGFQKFKDWGKSEKGQAVGDMATQIAGYGSMGAGLISNIMQRKNLEMAPEVQAPVMSASDYKAHLINRSQGIRDIIDSSAGTRESLKRSSSGDFGQLAANLQGVNASTTRAVADYSLQANMADAAELGRVDQLKAQAKQYNMESQLRTEDINAQNRAAYDYQKASLGNAITQNIMNIGSTLLNSYIAKKVAKSQGEGMMAAAMANNT